MRALEECCTYQPDITRLTKANSFIADGRVIYVTKKDYEGKANRMYIAYDSSTKVQLAAHHDKNEVVKFLQGKDLSVLGVDSSRLF
jgi:hypothetical protein